jgi:cysteine desulfuration protein SufE
LSDHKVLTAPRAHGRCEEQVTVIAPPKLAQFLEDLKLVDRELLGELLIETASRIRPLPERFPRSPLPEEAKVPACESEVYLFSEPAGAGLDFHFVVQNPQGISAKALAVILSETLSGEDVSLVAQIDPSFVYMVFGRNLSMGKGQGLISMASMVKALAERELKERSSL